MNFRRFPVNDGLTKPRREFLQASLGGGLTMLTSTGVLSGEKKRRPKVAAIFTSFRYRSHAHVIIENFLEPYLFNGNRIEPLVEVVSFYADQFPEHDMAREAAKSYGIPIYPSIADALTLGGKKLAVDAALSIAEHGNYPVNEFGQIEYPHKRFFDSISTVVKDSGRAIPVFNDKHLSHLWSESKEVYQSARELRIPLMAGSSVPLAQRRPPLELPNNCQFKDALVIHGGPIEAYGFHAFEILLSMVESRRGGETGVSRVEFLDEDALRRACRQGRGWLELAETAMKAEVGEQRSPFEPFDGEKLIEPVGALVTHRDGLKTMIMRTASYNHSRWNFACRLRGEDKVRATNFHVGPWENRNLFKALSHAIQQFFVTGQAPYPVERTLMVSGMLDASMKSKHKNAPVNTPQLEFAYPTQDFRAMRETGASWKIITDDAPQPKGIDSADHWLKM